MVRVTTARLNLLEYRNTIYMSESMLNKSRAAALPGFSLVLLLLAALTIPFLAALPCAAQDWIRTGTGLGVDKVRIAVPDFKPSTADPKNSD